MPLTLVPAPILLSAETTSIFSSSFWKNYNNGTTYSRRVSGRNPAQGTSFAEVWGYPSTTHGAAQLVRAFPAGAFTLAVCSDNAADTNQTVMVQYLDVNYLPWVAVYTLNGQTAVTVATSITAGFLPGAGAGGTVTNCFRVNDLMVLTGTANGVNAGNLYAFDNSSTVTAGVPQTTTKVFACAMIGDNIATIGGFTIAAGYFGALVQGITGMQTVGTSNIFGKMVLQIDNAGNLVFISVPINNVACNCAPSVVPQNLVSILPPQSTFRIQCQAGATGAEAVSVFNLLMWPTA
jgi:hypothetical protein